MFFFSLFRVAGPATIRMVSTNSTPPLPLPMQVPPGEQPAEQEQDQHCCRHLLDQSQQPCCYYHSSDHYQYQQQQPYQSEVSLEELSSRQMLASSTFEMVSADEYDHESSQPLRQQQQQHFYYTYYSEPPPESASGEFDSGYLAVDFPGGAATLYLKPPTSFVFYHDGQFEDFESFLECNAKQVWLSDHHFLTKHMGVQEASFNTMGQVAARSHVVYLIILGIIQIST